MDGVDGRGVFAGAVEDARKVDVPIGESDLSVMAHDLIARHRGVGVGLVCAVVLAGRRVARRVRADVAVVGPARAAPGSGVARAAAIGR